MKGRALNFLEDRDGLKITVLRTCGHEFHWNNKFIDPDDKSTLAGYKRYLSRMICPERYQCQYGGELGQPS